MKLFEAVCGVDKPDPRRLNNARMSSNANRTNRWNSHGH